MIISMKKFKYFFEDLNLLNKEYSLEIIKEFKNFINNGTFILGRNVEKFEKNFSKFLSSRYSVGVGNCLDALIFSIQVLKLKKKSEVIVPANAYIAAPLAIYYAGLKIVPVEPCIKTYNLDFSKIEERITPNTSAIMAVHLYGKPAEMIEILKIAKKYNLKLIEDCAQALGASISNKKVGTFGDTGCFSFYPSKNLGGMGDGGMVSVKEKYLFNQLKKIRNYGSVIRFKNEILGRNSRLDDIQAMILNIKLRKLKEKNDYKVKLAKMYNNELKDDFIKPQLSKNVKDVFHIYNIRFSKRSKLIKYLTQNGIQTDIHYPIPFYKQNCFKNFFNRHFPISDEIHRTTLSLPISCNLSEENIYKICKIMNKF